MNQEDTEKVRELAIIRDMTTAELLREAILQYLNSHLQERVNEIEGIYAQQLVLCIGALTECIKDSADRFCNILERGIDRICGLLARNFYTVQALYLFIGKSDEETATRLRECTILAKRQLREKLEPEAKELAAAVKHTVMQV
ncbi:MAG: hypothetical protein K2Y39_14380 [Candidatus Obscuribacterales bacterium]|nr:hypothetical protein [Candidatus Obscuribacterales bacterium]